MTNLTFAQLRADLLAAAAEPDAAEVPEEYLTAARFMEDSGIPETSARRLLNSLVRHGFLRTAKVRIDGHRRRVYWFPQQEEQ